MEPLTLESAECLVQWAEEYQVDALKSKCEDFLISSAPVDGKGFQFAVKYGLRQCTEQCLKAMMSNLPLYIHDLHVLTSKECQEYLAEFWPLITREAGLTLDMPPVERVASMWLFLVEAVRRTAPSATLDKIRTLLRYREELA
mmetsp:Transcript_54840/g.113294  ORF Transcript_54840/g.113294 Transcript_54840/m.113294 type:complete len:143 (-) Transcript_54840:13-441(-)